MPTPSPNPDPMAVRRLDRLILFTRYPEPGKTKTRLIPALGEEGAAALQRRMTERIAGAVRSLAVRSSLEVEVRYEGGSRDRMRRWLGDGWSFRRQGGGDIGERMARALAGAFGAGAHRAVLIGADIPGITAELLTDAFESLARRDVVIGPAADGGYYLIGMTRKGHAATGLGLFTDVAWGTDTVFGTTVARLAAEKIAFRRLPVLRDVDRPEDLDAWPMEQG